MKISTERAEELAEGMETIGLYSDAGHIRSLAAERDNQANEIARLKTIIRNLESRDIHSCGPDCQRSGCINRRLREQLAAVEKERDELKRFHELDTLQIAYLFDERKELAAAQAREAKLREWLEKWCKFDSLNMDLQEWFKLSDEYKAMQRDDTALREMLAEQRDKAAMVCEKSDRYRGDYFAERIRAMPLVIDKGVTA